jgi:hypothetical protein
MWNTQLFAHASRIIDGVERATRTVRDVIAVAEQFHRCPNNIVSLLDEHRSRYG